MYYSDEQTERELARLEKAISREYTTAYKELREKTAEYFESFAVRDARMKAAIEAGEYPIPAGMTPEQYYAQWRKNQIGRGKRWEKLRDDMAKRIGKANKLAASYINDTTPGIYSLNHNYEAYEIEDITGVAFDIYNEQTVKQLIKGENHTEFRTVSVNPVRDYLWNTKKINTALTSGILQGKSIKGLTDSFMSVMKNNRAAAIRNARTAVTSAQNSGRQECYNRASEKDIEVQKEWMSAHDSRVRDSHQHLDGVIVKYNEPFPNGLMYPGDPSGEPKEVYNCRCTMVARLPQYSDYSLAKGSRTGNTKRKYEQWLKSKANKAKITEAIALDDTMAPKFTKEEIIENLKSSPVGLRAIDYIEQNNVDIKITKNLNMQGIRGEQRGNSIIIYENNIKSCMSMGQTIVHECTHARYNIGCSQHAEAVCFSMEKMHKEGRDYLTQKEWEYCRDLAINAYPELNWEAGGYGDYEQFDFVKV